MTRSFWPGVVIHEATHDATVRQAWVTTDRFRQTTTGLIPVAYPHTGCRG